jgi:uncharacterized membrane protein (UPF0182 family)
VIDQIEGRSRPRRRLRRFILVLLVAVFIGGRSALSYYVEALWFASLGYADVFWKTLNFQGLVFTVFAVGTFVVLYGAYLLLKPAHLGDFGAGVILVNGRPVRLPVEPVMRIVALIISLIVAVVTGASMMAQWPTFGLWWYGSADGSPGVSVADSIFGRPIGFYLFTLPAWQLVAAWLMTLAVLCCAAAFFFFVVSGGRALIWQVRRGASQPNARRLAFAWAGVLLMLAIRVYLGRFERLFDAHSIFTGVTYTDAHVWLTGMLVVAVALVAGAVFAAATAIRTPRVYWLLAAAAPAAVCYLAVGLIAGYVNGFIVKPNELVRERPYIAHNIELTRQAYGLTRVSQRAFPAETSIEAVDLANNQATLRNIRLWDWRALQDTLRQIQEIRTYYDFPDIDIDRYVIDGEMRQVMLATRELSVRKLPESSRTWINEKLIYTHGYGVTMNLANGFTPEGLPALILSNMPVQSTVPALSVKRPEVYFGELSDTDVYVKTRQKEFNYPQGETNSLTSYEGTGGIVLGGLLRRILIALDRGDVTKVPFSDDIMPDSRLLMRRSLTDRLTALAPFLTFDSDPYIVVGEDGRLSWIIDAFTVSDTYPYSRAYRLAGNTRPINYIRNSVKVVVDAYDGATTLYVFDPADPVIAAYRRMFPSLFKDAAAMPSDLRKHVRYPELLLELQAQVYGLYHMTSPEVFYNREDLWTVATDVGMNQRQEQTAQPMEPNFVLMTLPGEKGVEFVEILPFTPANRNNLIGWIAGRSDDPHYGEVVVYDFPKTRLVDGPLQIEARIDQNPQLSGQLSLWNQEGSRVRRGALLVIPIGRALLYAEPIYLQAERSPMPELRLVVLALQDRLAYGPTFDAALTALFGAASSSTSTAGAAAAPGPRAPSTTTPEAPTEVDALIAEAAKDLADYQRLTAEGKLGEAGQKLEHLKRALEELSKRKR